MKTIVTLIMSVLGCLGLSAESPVEYFNVGNPLKYCGTDFYLKWSANPQDGYFVQEYLPKGESLDHFNEMFTVNVVFMNLSPQQAIQAKIHELETRKKTDPVVNYKVSSKDNGEKILEFIVSQGEGGFLNVVEVNVYHYKQISINGHKALVLSFYSGRAYGDDILPYIESIPEKRLPWYEGMDDLKIKPKFPKKYIP